MRLAVMLAVILITGCAPLPDVERFIPEALSRGQTVAVVHPAGHAFALKPEMLQHEIAEGLRRAGFARVVELPEGDADRRGAPLVAVVRSELMARPLEGHDLVYPGYHFEGERVEAILELFDAAGRAVYRASRIDRLSSALTEAKVAGALIRPLEEPAR